MIKHNENEFSAVKVGSVAFIISISVLLLYYIAYYPGYFSPDSEWQYNQALTNTYNDWHPVLDTLINFKLPLVLSNGWIGSMAIFQILILSVVLSYMFISICKYTSVRCAGLVLAFILLNPTTGMMALYVGKDTCFSVCVLYLMTSAMHIYYSNGLWLRKVSNSVLFVAVITIATIVRHNAILFTIPFLIAVFFLVSKKKGIIIILAFLLTVALIKWPVYSLIGIKEGENRQTEMVGLPMNIIGAAVVNNPDALDEDILQFAYRVAPKEVWESKYQYGSFNNIKFGENCDKDYINNYPITEILNMTFRTIKLSPGVALTALYKTTCTVYSVTDEFVYSSALTPYDSEKEINGVSFFQPILDKYRDLTVNAFSHIFMYSGFMLLVLVIFALVNCKLNIWEDWKRLLLVLPVFFYNYGTMLFLTSVWDGTRFFYYTFLVTPVLLIILVRKRKNAAIHQ